MGTRNFALLSKGGYIQEIVETGVSVSEWIEVPFEAGLLLKVPLNASAVVEQATELNTVAASSPETVRGAEWSLGVITGPKDTDSFVMGATHVRLRVLSGAAPVSLMIRGKL